MKLVTYIHKRSHLFMCLTEIDIKMKKEIQEKKVCYNNYIIIMKEWFDLMSFSEFCLFSAFFF